jgi:DNA (cytosine-5)-methyltransferase 1
MQAGALPAGGVDIWPAAIKVFKANFPHATGYYCDVRDLDPCRLSQELGRIDLLLASPECVAHSVARGGKQRPDDALSRNLAYEIIRFARILKPRWVVVENVTRMAKWPEFPEWCRALEAAGYYLLVCRLNACDFGVPQRRIRLFVIADSQRLPVAPQPCRRQNVTAADVIRQGGDKRWSWDFSPLVLPSRATRTIERARRAITMLNHPEQFLMVYYGSDGAGGFQTLDRPLRTVTTLDRFALVRRNGHGYEMRMLQPPELAAAMGFPGNYRWPDGVSRRDCVRMLGNAVCPPVVRAIVRSLLKHSRANGDRGAKFYRLPAV